MLIGLLTAFPLVLAFMFSMTDMTSVMNANWPAVELLYQVTGSKACTITLTVLLIVIYACESVLQNVQGRRFNVFCKQQPTSLLNGSQVAGLHGLLLVIMERHFQNISHTSTLYWSFPHEQP